MPDDLTLLRFALTYINNKAADLERQLSEAEDQIKDIERQLAMLIAQRNQLLVEDAAAHRGERVQ